MRTEYSKALISLGHENPKVIVLGADTTGSLKTASFGKEFPDRFFNVGIAEANLVSVSAGMAISGKIPFASTYAIFLPGRAVDQIRNSIAYPTRGDKKGLDVKLVVSHGGLSVGRRWGLSPTDRRYCNNACNPKHEGIDSCRWHNRFKTNKNNLRAVWPILYADGSLLYSRDIL